MAWYIEEYKSASGNLPVSRWYNNKLTKRDQAIADTTFYEIRNKETLTGSSFKKLKGKKFQALWEVRWFGINRVPYRILYYNPRDRVITFLCGCTKRSIREYNPRNALNTAAKRHKEIETGKAGTHEFTY